MLKRHTISFQNALNGLLYALASQPNYKIHLTLSLLAILGGIFLRITYFEFLLITVLIFVGLTIETINTAIEQTTDAIDKKWREDIKLAKDIAAGAMLIYAVGAFVVACIVFVPRIIILFG